VWSVLLPLLFSELQSPLLPILLIPDDVYGSELLSMVSNAVVPTLNDAIRLLDATLQILLDSMRQYWRITGCYRNSRLVTFATGRTCQRAVFVTYAVLPSKFWWNAFADAAILKPYTLSQTTLKQCSLIQANVLKQYSRQLLVDRRNPRHCSA